MAIETSQAPSRRIRKTHRTRSQVQQAAIALILEKGFDAVTIAEIAEAADVDPSTVWRHFKSKEAVLFTDQEDWLNEFHRTFSACPKDQNIFEATITALRSAAKVIDPEFDQLRSRVFAHDPAEAVKAAIASYESAARDEIARSISARMGVEPSEDARPFVVATMIMSAAQWFRIHRASRTTRSLEPTNYALLEDLIHEVIALVNAETIGGKAAKG